MRGNPSPCCSLMGRHGIGVCREWLNFARRPGTIKSRMLLCNRPFPSHNATSGKTCRRGAEGWKPQCLDQKREKYFFVQMTQDYIKEKLGYHIFFLKSILSQMRCDPPHQMQKCWIWLLLMLVNEYFYTLMHDSIYFLTDGNIWILYVSVLFIRFLSCVFPPLTLSTCLAQFDSDIYLNALKLPLCPNFFTPTMLDYSNALYPLNEAREISFPVKSIIFKWSGPFFLFATRHKVIKS